MVKRLGFCWWMVKRGMLIATMLVLALAFWLHGTERSLNIMKPWIVAAVNDDRAPYVINIADVTINWQSAVEFGKLRVKGVTFAKRDGAIFGQLPELYVTLDPIGFLPRRNLLHKVILRNPNLFITRNGAGEVELGFEDSSSRLPLSQLAAFATTTTEEKISEIPALPFHDFVIDAATLRFNDTASGTDIISSPFNFRLTRHFRSYDAVMSLPFTVDGAPVKLLGGVRKIHRSDSHLVSLTLDKIPARLICLFGTCLEGMKLEGPLTGVVAAAVGKDFSLQHFKSTISTSRAKLNAPQWFVEPLKISQASIAVEGDWSKRIFALTQATAQMEDTTLTATGNAHKTEAGWFVNADAAHTTPLDISKLYKYWPLTMAPDSRTWITNKLKSGHSAKARLKLNLTPDEFAAENFSEKAVDAVVDAREITFEYLPGFPLVEKMNGIAHFTGTTVKVEGGGGSMLSGTVVHKAVLWCPQLLSSHNPMEATLSLSAPSRDAASILALKHFTFEDGAGLNPKTIEGSVDAEMKLVFDAFSGKSGSDPNEIHLEAVNYDISTVLHDVAQEDLFGGYALRNTNGQLTARNGAMAFVGSLRLGDSPLQQVTMEQKEGEALTLSVKGQTAASESTDAKSEKSETRTPVNNFSLMYRSGEQPEITITGSALDASSSYSKHENGLLANFPAMKLKADLGEVWLSRDQALTQVKASLECSTQRCEAGNASAQLGKGKLEVSITQRDGQRYFKAESNNAGQLLTALDITDRMYGGAFGMNGIYDDSKTPPRLNSRLLITDFTLKNSEILGRILSIASLTGIANALTGSGIAFEKLSANIASEGGIITVDKGIASGTAMGITVAGVVDTNTSRLNLKGVVAPAYALNSIFSKIPIIGAIAGKEGEGLIAFNYSVDGTYAEPDVSVNPLSGLTPGFLRGIFSIFDDDSGVKKDVKSKENKVLQENMGAGRVKKH